MVDPQETGQLVWEEVLPVAFIPGEGATDARLVAHRVAANLRVLQTCEALEERRCERDDEAAGHPDGARLEKKLDLLIEMMGHLVSRAAARPPAVVAALSAVALEWRCEAASPPPGSIGIAEVHLREGVAEALRLPGRVGPAQSGGRALLRFEGLTEVESDALERFVFRQHRRAVAGQRRSR